MFKTFYSSVSKNRDTPKWMVYNGNPIKMDDLGVPLFSETSIYIPKKEGHQPPQPYSKGCIVQPFLLKFLWNIKLTYFHLSSHSPKNASADDVLDLLLNEILKFWLCLESKAVHIKTGKSWKINWIGQFTSPCLFMSFCTWQFFVIFLGWLSDPFQWLSDLQLGDEKVTLNHLVYKPFANKNTKIQPSPKSGIESWISVFVPSSPGTAVRNTSCDGPNDGWMLTQRGSQELPLRWTTGPEPIRYKWSHIWPYKWVTGMK